MSELGDTRAERELTAELTELSRRHEPPAGWETRVWARALRQQTAADQRSWWSRNWIAATAICALATALLVVSGLWHASEREHASAHRAAAEQLARAEHEKKALAAELVALDAEIDRLQHDQDALHAQLGAADNEAERDAIRRRLAAKRAGIARAKRQRELARNLRHKKEREKIKVKCDPSDPLCGIVPPRADKAKAEAAKCEQSDPLCGL